MVRHLRCLVPLVGVVLAAALAAQEPEPVPPPAPSPQQQPAEPPATAPDPDGDGRPERANTGRRRPGQGQGDGEQEDLPAFTPVTAPSPAGLLGKQYFWFTMYPHFLVQYDPATDAVVRKCELAGGMFWSTHLTHDRRRMLVVTDQQRTIEVVDLATATLLGRHDFAEEGYVLRIRDVRECAGCVHWLVRTERVKKEIDRYSFEPAQWLLYDSEHRKIVRRLRRLPEPLERGAQLSADGTHWLGQDQDGNLVAYDARTCKEIGRIDLRTPRHFGAGAIRLLGHDLLDRRDPERAQMLFTSTDPVETRRTSWGLVELDLAQRRIVDVQEWGPNPSSFGLRIAHRARIAAAMGSGFGSRSEGDNRTRLVVYDLTNGKKLAESFEEFRPRRSLVAIAPDGDKIYIGTAGSDFEVFDRDLKRLKTVELDGEVVGRIYTIDG